MFDIAKSQNPTLRNQKNRKAIFEYIEAWYNLKKSHSSIGYIMSVKRWIRNSIKQHNFSDFFAQVCSKFNIKVCFLPLGNFSACFVLLFINAV